MSALATTCHTFRQSAFISMDTFVNMSQIQKTFISPSVCDSMYIDYINEFYISSSLTHCSELFSLSFFFTDINQCNPDPCNGHPCVDKVNAYKCLCNDGYTGEFCQNQPDYCRDNPCKNNGTCSNTGGNFTCSCPSAYKGDQCQFQIGIFLLVKR